MYMYVHLLVIDRMQDLCGKDLTIVSSFGVNF